MKYESEYKLGLTNKSLLSDFSDQEFLFYLSFILWVAMILAGLYSEVIVWLMFLDGKWDQEKENKGKIAQFVLTLLRAATVSLVNSQNYLSVPLLIVTM